MKIIRNTNKEVSFSSIPIGTVFIYSDSVFMKCCVDSPYALNTVRLDNGVTFILEGRELVIPCYKATLNLNEEAQIVEKK